jgi:hypothetical protein
MATLKVANNTHLPELALTENKQSHLAHKHNNFFSNIKEDVISQ